MICFYRRTVTNKMTGQNVVLSKEDLSLIQNLQGSKHPDSSTENYEVNYQLIKQIWYYNELHLKTQEPSMCTWSQYLFSKKKIKPKKCNVLYQLLLSLDVKDTNILLNPFSALDWLLHPWENDSPSHKSPSAQKKLHSLQVGKTQGEDILRP